MQVNIRLVEAIFMDKLSEDYAGISQLQQNRLSGNGEDDATVSLALSKKFHTAALKKRREAKKCRITCDLDVLHSWDRLDKKFRDSLIALGRPGKKK